MENYDEYVDAKSVNQRTDELNSLQENQKPDNTLNKDMDYDFTINLSNKEGLNRLIDGISFDEVVTVKLPRTLTISPYKLYFYDNPDNNNSLEVQGSFNTTNKFIEYVYRDNK